MANKSSKFGIGIFLGAVAGAVAGLFLAPKSGVEMRKDARKLSKKALAEAKKYQKQLEGKEPEEIAKKVFGDVSEKSVKIMKQAHKDLSVELALLNQKYKKIDKDRYAQAVKLVVTSIKEEGSVPESELKKLSAYLQEDAKKLVARPVNQKAKKPASRTSRTSSTSTAKRPTRKAPRGAKIKA